jgi:thermitase
MKKETYYQTSFISHHSNVLKPKKLKLQLLIRSIFMLTLFLLPAMALAIAQPRPVRIMIQLEEAVSDNDCAPFCKDNMIKNPALDAIHKQLQVNKIQKIGSGRATGKHIYVVELGENENIDEVIASYKKTGVVMRAEADHMGYGGGHQMLNETSVIPDDEFFGRQWSLQNDGSFTLSPAVAGRDIKMPDAWNIETGDPDLIIAILDSGINTLEADIKDRLWRNPGEQVNGEPTNNGVDDDGNGYIDDHLGWNFTVNNNKLADGSGHGSNIAGIIGAQANNGIGYTGINWNSKIMVLKAIDDKLLPVGIRGGLMRSIMLLTMVLTS